MMNPTKFRIIDHYAGRKPWNCIGVGHGGGRIPGLKPGSAIDTNAGNFGRCCFSIRFPSSNKPLRPSPSHKWVLIAYEEHCMELQSLWHLLRLDLEREILSLTGNASMLRGSMGTYKKDIFQGHCLGEGGDNYTSIQLVELPSSLDELLYI
jgi:hypothetical protein